MKTHPLTTKSLVGEGGYSHIFAYDADTVIKLFRRQRIVEGEIAEEGDHEVVLRAVFDAECSAYERLAQYPDLARFAPHFYGRVVVPDVLSPTGESIAASYLPDCAYRIQRIPGTDCKLGQLTGSALQSEIEKFLVALEVLGICYTCDGSVFVPGIGTPFMLIDFATWDAMADLANGLIANGRLTDASRARWAARTSK